VTSVAPSSTRGNPSDALNQKLKNELFKAGSTATFTSKEIKVAGNNEGTITGDFTINGVTKPVTLQVKFTGGKPFPFGDKYLIGFAATGSFKRSDFGLTEMQGAQFASDVVNLQIDIEFLQVK